MNPDDYRVNSHSKTCYDDDIIGRSSSYDPIADETEFTNYSTWGKGKNKNYEQDKRTGIPNVPNNGYCVAQQMANGTEHFNKQTGKWG